MRFRSQGYITPSQLSLLSLILLSYIVMPNRVLENIQFSPLAFTSTAPQIDYLLADMVMDLNITKNVDNYNNNCQDNSCVNIVVDPIILQKLQCISNKVLALNLSSSPYVDNDNVINIQLLYDPN